MKKLLVISFLLLSSFAVYAQSGTGMRGIKINRYELSGTDLRRDYTDVGTYFGNNGGEMLIRVYSVNSSYGRYDEFYLVPRSGNLYSFTAILGYAGSNPISISGNATAENRVSVTHDQITFVFSINGSSYSMVLRYGYN